MNYVIIELCNKKDLCPSHYQYASCSSCPKYFENCPLTGEPYNSSCKLPNTLHNAIRKLELDNTTNSFSFKHDCSACNLDWLNIEIIKR